MGPDQGTLDGDEVAAKPAGGKGSSSSSSSASAGPRPDPPKKTRFQSDAPDDLQLAMDISAALAKDKEASNILPAPATTGNINVAASSSTEDGTGDAAVDNVVPSTPPSLG